MTIEHLESRVAQLEKALTVFSEELRWAYRHMHPDAASSLTKSRAILEKLVVEMYLSETGREPRKPLLGDMLADNQFTRKIDRRILSRMNAIRDMGNLGAHCDAVNSRDAARVLDDLCEVLEWYLQRHVSSAALSSDVKVHAQAASQKADRIEENRRLLSEFFRPLQVRLLRDKINWRRILDLEEPEGSIRRRVAEQVEQDYILPNHQETVALIERYRHLVESDAELIKTLDAFVHHVVVYRAIRSSGDKVTLPIDLGAPWPQLLLPLVELRIHQLESFT